MMDVADLRREYTRGGLHRADLPADPLALFEKWLAQACEAKLTDPTAMVVGTVDADGQPWQLEDRWINLEATPAARDTVFSSVGPNEWLVSQVPFSDVEVSFLAVSADEEQALHLGCNRGDALFRIERQTTWQGQVVTWVGLTYRRDHRMTTRY